MVVSLGVFEVLAQAIGGDAVTVTNIARRAGDAHEIELSPSQSEALRTADLAVLPEEGFQAVVDDAAASRTGETVRLGSGSGSGSEAAPHFWVDPRQLATAAEDLGSAIADLQKSEAGSAVFRERTDEVVSELNLVADRYDQRLKDLGRDEVAAEHASMETLAHRYHFSVEALSGTAHDAEPTPGQLVTVATALRSHRILTVLVEPTSNRAVANAALRAAGVTGKTASSHIAVFDNFELLTPAETSSTEPGALLKPLTSGFRRNFTSLGTALDCLP